MQLATTIILLLILVPAALAGIGGAMLEAVVNLECVSNALPHAQAFLAELAPMAPGLGLLMAGFATLGVAAWLIVRVVNGG